MAFLPDLLIREVRDFIGPWLRTDQYTVPQRNALFARNCSYIRGQVTTRNGYSAVFNPNEIAASLYNWQSNELGVPKNRLLYYAPLTGVRSTDLSNLAGGTITLIPVTGAYGAFFTSAGSRVYVSFFDSNGVGMAPAQVYSFGNLNDTLFAPPMTVAPTMVNAAGAGVVTAGQHRFGYILTTRNGFTTKPSPFSGSSFAPVNFTATGGLQATFSLTATWPSYAGSIQVVMSTVANPQKYYLVPGASASVPAGGTTTVNITVNISDADLAATGTDANQYLNLLTQDVNGNAPFKPAVIVMYSNRACYVTSDAAGIPVIYISDTDAYQQINAAFGGLYLPGQAPITTAISLRGVLYIFGPHATYSVTDQGGYPTTWSRPTLVDGSIGTLSPYGVFASSSQGFVWVADEGGLYLFQGGPYPDIPISYYQQTDWLRINWAAAASVQVIDNKNNKRVYVMAPLDGATTPSHVLAWDYTDGTSPDQAKYALYDMASYPFRSLAMVQNNTTKHLEVWMGPATAGRIIRENDGSEAFPFRDTSNVDGSGTAINSQYETSLLPGLDADRGQIHAAQAAALRIRGSGNLSATVYTLDHATAVPVNGGNPIPLAVNPGKEVLLRFSAVSEQSSLFLTVNALDSYFILSTLQWFYTKSMLQR